jgi:phosphoribosylanthranilate isomerase
MPVEVKICGLKTEAALDAALEAGADYVGFVFFAKSPRNLSIAEAARLARRVREKSKASVVALVVDPSDRDLDEIAIEVSPDVLQLHGQESPERVCEIARNTDAKIWKAISVATAADIHAVGRYMKSRKSGGAPDLILFDAKPPPDPAALPGGNGLSFDWRILDGVKGRYSYALAGGLTPENVADAIRLTGAAIVDVSSGVEKAPGVKDPELIRRFLKAAKAANQS